MSDRFVTWGTRDGERRLFTFELDPEDAQIRRRILPAAASSDDLLQTILNGWKQFTPIAYPEATEVDVAELTAAGTIVPAGAEVDDKLRVASAEREWPFDVVSARMRKAFQAELEEMRDVIGGLEAFDEAIFERLKGLWDRVQHELDAKVLRYEHVEQLRKLSGDLFDRMKRLRRGKEKTVRSRSREVRDGLQAKLAEAQVALEGKADLRGLFNHLREVQAEVNKAQLARDDRNKLRKRLDELFKATKSEIDASGADAGYLTEQRTRLESRLRGLEGAVRRMEGSVRFDRDNVGYEQREIQRSDSQLAVQLGAAKIQMLEQKLAGKQAKLDDMHATLADLQKKHAQLGKREEKARAKREAQQAERAAATAVASSDGAESPRAPKPRRRQREGGALVPFRLVSDVAAAIGVVTGEPNLVPPRAPGRNRRKPKRGRGPKGAPGPVIAHQPEAPQPEAPQQEQPQRPEQQEQPKQPEQQPIPQQVPPAVTTATVVPADPNPPVAVPDLPSAPPSDAPAAPAKSDHDR